MEEHWFARTVGDVEKTLHTDVQAGLAAGEAARRARHYGPNRLPEPPRDSWRSRVLRQFKNPIALLLLVATPAALYAGGIADAAVITIALLINIAIGVFQEGRAAHAFEALARDTARRASVLRAGERSEVDASMLVPGDVIVLAAGSTVPADVRITEAHELLMNESALTGEWVPVQKGTEPVARGAPLAEQSAMAYAGSLVVGGVGKGIVVATGSATELGAIAAELAQARAPETPLARDLRYAGHLLLLFAALIIASVVALAVVRGIPFSETLLIAVAVAVASVPEGLPAAVTVSLALGMERILKKGGLVKTLPAAETLGATTVILTDKTGTLTEGSMHIMGFATLAGTTEDLDGAEAKHILRAAMLASDGYVEQVALPSGETTLVAHGRPMEQAIMLSGTAAGLMREGLRAEHPRFDVLPFDAARRFGGTLVAEGGERVAYLSGAPELFIASARRARGASGMRPFTPREAAFWDEALRHAARASERVIAVVRAPWREETLPADSYDELFARAELLGFILFSDPVRPEARQAVRDMQAAGARVVMLTGDNPDTALAIARTVGIAGPYTTAHTGADLDGLSDEALYGLVASHTVFARVVPKQKLRIANVLTSHGEVVAMTGDGVNDAPALHASAIGIALGSGTEVAKEAADLVLLEDSFSVITAAIREGRRLRDNMKKIFAYLVATNFGEALVVIAAFVGGLPLPLLPAQILWSNLVTGGPMNVAFAFEPLYESAMRRKPKDEENARVLSRTTLRFIALVGLSTGLMLVALLAYLASRAVPEAELRTIMFVAISIDSLFTALSLKSFGTPIWRIPLLSNRFLLAALGIALLLLAGALYVPPLVALIGAVPLGRYDLVFLFTLGAADLALVELVKYLLFIRPGERARRLAARA